MDDPKCPHPHGTEEGYAWWNQRWRQMAEEYRERQKDLKAYQAAQMAIKHGHFFGPNRLCMWCDLPQREYSDTRPWDRKPCPETFKPKEK